MLCGAVQEMHGWTGRLVWSLGEYLGMGTLDICNDYYFRAHPINITKNGGSFE